MLLIFFWYIIKYKKVIDTKYDCIQGNEIKFMIAIYSIWDNSNSRNYKYRFE